MNPQHQLGTGPHRQGQPVYYMPYQPQAGYPASYGSYYRHPPSVPSHLMNQQYQMPPPQPVPAIYPPQPQPYQYNYPAQTFVSSPDQQHALRPAPAITPPPTHSTQQVSQPLGQYRRARSTTPPTTSPGGYSGGGAHYPWSTAVTSPSLVHTFTGDRPSTQHVPYPLPSRLKLRGELRNQGTSVDPPLQSAPQLNSSKDPLAQPYKPPQTITTTATESDLFQQKVSQYGSYIENPILTNNPATIRHSQVANVISTTRNFKPSVLIQKDTSVTVNSLSQTFKPYDNVNTSAVPISSLLPNGGNESEGLQKQLNGEVSPEDDNNSAVIQSRYGSLFNRAIRTVQRENSREDTQCRSISASPVNIDEFTPDESFPSVTGINLDIVKNCVEANAQLDVESGSINKADESFKSVGETFDSGDELDFFDDTCIIEEHEFLSFDVISSPFDLCNQQSSTEEDGIIEEVDIQPAVNDNNKDSVEDSIIKHIENSIMVENSTCKRLVNVKETGPVKMMQCNTISSGVKYSSRKVYAKQILESEKKQADIILKGISDENISALAAAIVKSAIGNAVIKVIEESESVDLLSETAKITDMGENNNDSEISSCTGNIHVNVEECQKHDAEYNASKTEDITDNNNDIYANNVEVKIYANDNEHSEVFEDKTENRLDRSDDSGGKNRLYSWPYTDTEGSEAEREEMENFGKQQEIKSSTIAEKCMIETVEVEGISSNKIIESTDVCFGLPMENSDHVDAIISEVVHKQKEDFEKQYFKSRASHHGITIISPEKAVKGIDTTGASSSSKDNYKHIRHNIARRRFHSGSRERRDSTDSDLYSTDSQSDASEAFIMKAKNLGIKIENPSSMDTSDAELESVASDKIKRSENSDNIQRRRTSTPTMLSIGNNLNAESPEWLPDWKRGAKSEMRGDAPAFTPDGRNRHMSHNSSCASLNSSGYNETLRIDAPVFKPDGVQRLVSESGTAMRVEAVEFQPRVTAPSIQPMANEETFDFSHETTPNIPKPSEPKYNHERSQSQSESPSKAKIFYLPTPKPKAEKPVKCIQASPTITNTGMNTRRIRTKDFGMATGGADSRDVSINTEDSQSSPGSQYYIDKQRIVQISKSTNTDKPCKRSVGVNIRGRSSAAMRSVATLTDPVAEKVIPAHHDSNTNYLLDKVKKLQIEVITFKANVELDRLKSTMETISKQAAVWINIFSESNDEEEMNQLVRNKLRSLHQARKTVMQLCKATIARVESGWVYRELPDFHSMPRSPEHLPSPDSHTASRTNPPLTRAWDSNIQFPKIDVSSILATQTAPLTMATDIEIAIKHSAESPGRFTNTATSPRKPESGHVTEMRCHVTPQTNQSQNDNQTNQTSLQSVDLTGSLKELEEMDMQHNVEGIATADVNELEEMDMQQKVEGIATADVILNMNTHRKPTSLMALEDYSDEEREDEYESINMNEIDDYIIKPNKTQPNANAGYGGNVTDVKKLISKTMEMEYTVKIDLEKSKNDIILTNVSEKENNLDESSGKVLSNDAKKLAEPNLDMDQNERFAEPNSDMNKSENVAETHSERNQNENLPESLSDIDKNENLPETHSEKGDEQSVLPDNDIGLDDANVVVMKEEGLELAEDTQVKAEIKPETGVELETSQETTDLPDEVKKGVTPPRNLKDETADGHGGEDMGAVGGDSSDVTNVKTPDVTAVENIPKETPIPDVHNKSDIFISPPAGYLTPEKLFSENKKKVSMEVVPTLDAAPVAATQNVPMMLGGIDPVLYQFVVSQLVQAYPDLATNPDMLCNVAIQQTSILCRCMTSDQVAGITGTTNMLDTMDPGMLGIMDPGTLGTLDPGMLGNVNLGILATGQQNPTSFSASPISDGRINPIVASHIVANQDNENNLGTVSSNIPPVTADNENASHINSNMSGGKEPLPIVPRVRPEIRKTDLSKPVVKETSALKPLYPDKEPEVPKPPGLRHLDERKADILIPAPERVVKPLGFENSMKFAAGSQFSNIPNSVSPTLNLKIPPPSLAPPTPPGETNQDAWPKPNTNQQPPTTSQPNLLESGLNDKAPLTGYDNKLPQARVQQKPPLSVLPLTGIQQKPPQSGLPQARVQQKPPLSVLPLTGIQQKPLQSGLPQAEIQQIPPQSGLPQAGIQQIPPQSGLPQAGIQQIPPQSGLPQAEIQQIPLLSGLPQAGIQQKPPLSGLPQARIQQIPPQSGLPQAGIQQKRPLSGLPPAEIQQIPPLSGLPQAGIQQKPPQSGLPQAKIQQKPPLSGLPQAGIQQQPPLSGLPQAGIQQQPPLSGLPQAGIQQKPPQSGLPQARIQQKPPLSGLPQAGIQQQPPLSGLPQAGIQQKPPLSGLPQAGIQQKPQQSGLPQAEIQQKPQQSGLPQAEIQQKTPLSGLPQTGFQQKPPLSGLPQTGIQQNATLSVLPQTGIQQKAAMSVLPQAGILQRAPLSVLPQAGIPQRAPLSVLPQAGIPQRAPLSGLPQARIPQRAPLSVLPQAVIPQRAPLSVLPQAVIPQKPPLSGLQQAGIQQKHPAATAPDMWSRFPAEPARSPTPLIPASTDFLPPYMRREPYRSNLPPRLQRQLSGNQPYEARRAEGLNENWNENASGGGIDNIPVAKVDKLDKEEKGDNEEGEQDEWCQVPPRKKKVKELKKYTAPYVNSVPLPSPRFQRPSNFERLVNKIQEDFPTSGRQEIIDAITEIRNQRGTMTGMNTTEILEKAFAILQRKSRQAFQGNWPQNQPQLSRMMSGPPMPSPADEEDICVICHDPLSSEPTKSLECGHAFHEHCINKWVYGRERTCPTCRQHALLPEEFPRLSK